MEYWIAALATYLGAQLISSRRWQMLAKPLGFRRSLTEFVRDFSVNATGA
jgi:hypothetical protein